MSNLARLNEDRSLDRRRLGPAEVLGIGGGWVEARLESGAVVRAVLALATPYEPSLGDVVLVTGEGDRDYVIGLLSGRGKTVLAFDGDVELRSTDGVVRIAGARGVEIEAPEVGVVAKRFTVVAEAAVQRVATLTHRVRELWSVHVGARHEVVEGSTITQARSATFVTEDEVKINGKSIHLG